MQYILYSIGEMNESLLKSTNFIETKNKSWFSLYNNSMKLNKSDINVPIIF